MLSAPSREDAAGFILAGGQSSRMGSDKALVPLQGRPLLAIALDALRAGIPAAIAGAQSDLSVYAPVIEDKHPGLGPLSGIHAALSASSAAWNLFLPVDMPLMPPSLLRLLLDRAILTGSPITATQLNGRLLPFPAVLHRSVLPHIAHCIATRQLACRPAWQSMPPLPGARPDSARLDAPSVELLRTLGSCSHPLGLPPYTWFFNANTPAELARIDNLLPARF
jgi:molybdopterin-guanine dinucleotide biosynthesis protein A